LNKLLAAFLVAILCSAWTLGSDGSETSQQPLRIVAIVEQNSKDVSLRFTVTNATRTALSIRESQLPWGSQTAITIVAVAANKDPLQQTYAVEDVFRETAVLLVPGQSKSGSVSLTARFPQLAAASKNSRVVVFWFYEPARTTEGSLGVYGGWQIASAIASKP
jgi:hypothetical protein